jgi:hypothetical protein
VQGKDKKGRKEVNKLGGMNRKKKSQKSDAKKKLKDVENKPSGGDSYSEKQMSRKINT